MCQILVEMSAAVDTKDEPRLDAKSISTHAAGPCAVPVLCEKNNEPARKTKNVTREQWDAFVSTTRPKNLARLDGLRQTHPQFDVIYTRLVSEWTSLREEALNSVWQYISGEQKKNTFSVIESPFPRDALCAIRDTMTREKEMTDGRALEIAHFYLNATPDGPTVAAEAAAAAAPLVPDVPIERLLVQAKAVQQFVKQLIGMARRKQKPISFAFMKLPHSEGSKLTLMEFGMWRTLRTGTCAQCQTTGAVKQCGGCGPSAYYCNKECQQTHWKNGHSVICKAQHKSWHESLNRLLLEEHSPVTIHPVVAHSQPDVKLGAVAFPSSADHQHRREQALAAVQTAVQAAAPM